MKTYCAIILFIVAMGGLAAPAQTVPKLAVAGVSVSPTLARQYVSSAVGTSPVQPADLEGVWNGSTESNGKSNPYVLTITKAADGSDYAEFRNVAFDHVFKSTSVSCGGADVTISFSAFNGIGKPGLLDGTLDASRSTMSVIWNNGRSAKTTRLTLKRAGTLTASSVSAETIAPSGDLAAISHTLDVQLADNFEAEHMFAVMEGEDLKSAIPPNENEPYNLKDSETARQFKKAGISYLLVTTLEELKNDTVDKAQGSVAYQIVNANVQAHGKNSKNKKELDASGSVLKTQGKFDPHRVIEQDIYLTVRCRLFDVASGDLLDSANYSFATNRTYVALAEGNKDVSDVDLFKVAAQNVSQWAVAREREAVFPITVLEKNDKEITINRGSGSGLHVGQVYNIYAIGKEIKDPVTGEVLGRDEITVGRVTINEIQPKFSKATIWEDKGITSGAILRRATAN